VIGELAKVDREKGERRRGSLKGVVGSPSDRATVVEVE